VSCRACGQLLAEKEACLVSSLLFSALTLSSSPCWPPPHSQCFLLSPESYDHSPRHWQLSPPPTWVWQDVSEPVSHGFALCVCGAMIKCGRVFIHNPCIRHHHHHRHISSSFTHFGSSELAIMRYGSVECVHPFPIT